MKNTIRHILSILPIFAMVVVVGLSPKSAFAATTGTLLPTSDGSFSQFTPSTGTSHFALVDEASCNGLTDYNSTTTVGNRDSYGVDISSVPNGATMTQISLTPCASRVNTGGTNPVMKLFYRLNGANSADSGSYTLTGTTPSVLGTTNIVLSTVKGSATTLEFGSVLTSGTKGARLSQLSGVITYTPLLDPSGLLATGLSTESARLNWTDNATNETGYKVERSTDGVNYTQIGLTGVNGVYYLDKNIVGSFYYRVRAYNSGADSAYTNVATASVSLAAPTFLSGNQMGTGSAQLVWNDNSKLETGYLVERGIDGVNFTQVGTTSANVNFYNDSGLAVGSYYYRVKATNGVFDSTYSNIKNITIL